MPVSDHIVCEQMVGGGDAGVACGGSNRGRDFAFTEGRNARSLFRIELQRGRIDAIPQASWLRTVIENMTKVRVALGAKNLGANHAVATIDHFVNALIGDWACEGRPSTASIEFRVGLEEFFAAADAAIDAGRRRFVVLAGECPLGSLLARYGILFWRQLLSPFAVTRLDLVWHRGLQSITIKFLPHFAARL